MFYPFMMPSPSSEPRRNILSEVEDNIKAMEAIKKALSSDDKDKDKKKDTPKKNPGDTIATAMFLTMATPFVMLAWFWGMSAIYINILENITRIKGLH